MRSCPNSPKVWDAPGVNLRSSSPPLPSGKLGASAGFVLAYMLPAEVFPTKMRGFAIGVANVFARMGSMIAPLCASAPPIVVQIGLGSMSIAICALAMAKLPDLRVALEP